MRITILTVGSRGDVQPYVALGCGLAQAGFEVRVATHAVFSDFVARAGLDFAPVGLDPHLLMKEVLPLWQERARHPLRLLRHMMRLLLPEARTFLQNSLRACQGADAIVFSPFGNVAYHIAEALRVPCVLAMIQPLSPTRAFPSPLAPPGLRLGAAYNRLTHLYFEQVSWQLARPLVNPWRVRTLGLAPLPPLPSPFGRMRRQRVPVLHAYSPAVLARPADWGPEEQIVGYWFLDPDPNWQPPAALAAFLTPPGPPPVCIGFGSTSHQDPEAFTQLILRALAAAGQRGVLLTGSGTLAAARLPDSVFALPAAPHDWLFPRSAAVVHHGGVGTTGAVLRAGLPGVCVPFFYDHPFWGRRLADLGVSPPALPLKKLTAERLAGALQVATGDAAMRARAVRLGEQIRAENGVTRAVEIVRQVLSTGPARRSWLRGRVGVLSGRSAQ